MGGHDDRINDAGHYSVQSNIVHVTVSSVKDLTTIRSAVASDASRFLGEELRDDVSIAVSELVTNALEYGHGSVAVRYGRADEATYQITVEGASTLQPQRFPQPVPPGHFEGRGLNIVAAVADDLEMSNNDGVATVTCRFVRR